MTSGVRLALPDVPMEPLCSPEPLTAKLGEVFIDGLPLSVPLAAPPLPPTPVGVLVGGDVGVEPPPPPPTTPPVGEPDAEGGREAEGENDTVREGGEEGVWA